MDVLIGVMPLVALVALLASGRVGPLAACAAAMLLSLPAPALALPPGALPGFAVRSVIEGLWLATVPVGIILGGLVFHAAIGQRDRDAEAPDPSPAGSLFTA